MEEVKPQLTVIELLESIRYRLGILVLFLVIIPLFVGCSALFLSVFSSILYTGF